MMGQRGGGDLDGRWSAGLLPMPEFNVYAATKAFGTRFSESRRAELRDTGVTVTALCPGPVHTEFGDVAKRPGGEPERGPEFVYVSVEKTVRDALAAVEADKPIVIPGLAMKLGIVLVLITPMRVLRLT